MNMRMGNGSGTAVRCLATDEMVEVAGLIQESYRHVMSNFLGDTRTQLTGWTAEWILTQKPYFLVTLEGHRNAMEAVFQNKHVTDFVFTLLHNFGARWGMAPERFAGLCANLAYSAVPKTSYSISSVPDAIADRLAASSEDAYQLLLANPWLVVLMLLQLFVSVSPQKV